MPCGNRGWQKQPCTSRTAGTMPWRLPQHLRRPRCRSFLRRTKHDTVDIPASKIKVAIAGILVDEGFIEKYDIIEDGNFKTIRVTLKYGADKNEKIITGIKRISKPGLRVYAGKDEIPSVLGGLGIAILSTNQGIVTDKEARKLQVGGEVLAFVW